MQLDQTHKEYFEQAYRTGTDVWSHIDMRRDIERILKPVLPNDSLVLDVGSGRGLVDFHLAKNGFRVIGLDYVDLIVAKGNQESAHQGLQNSLRFVAGDALDMPFTDAGYDAVVDAGMMQHLPKEEWGKYLREVHRVLKPGGVFLSAALSKQTTMFMGHSPAKSEDGFFEKYGLSYYFFTAPEFSQIISVDFKELGQIVYHYDSRSDPGEDISMLFTLAQKN